MPIRTFWSMIRNANKLKAANDMRLLHLLVSSQNGDAIQETSQALKTEQGTPVVAIDNRRDTHATQKLREAFG